MRREKMAPGPSRVQYKEVSAEQVHELHGGHPGGIRSDVKLNANAPQELFAHSGPVYELGSPTRPDDPNKPVATAYQ